MARTKSQIMEHLRQVETKLKDLQRDFAHLKKLAKEVMKNAGAERDAKKIDDIRKRLGSL